MEILLIVIAVALVVIVLLQAGKAETASGVLTGGSSAIFTHRKERGGELFISRLTFILGALFMLIAFLIMLSS